MQIAMPSRILEDRAFLRKPASRPMKLPRSQAIRVLNRDRNRV